VSRFKKIIFLTPPSKLSRVQYDFLFPIFQCEKYLKDLGYDIEVTDRLDSSLNDCDVFCILSTCLRYYQNDKYYIEELESIIKYSNKTFFFDISDNGGALYEKGLEICDVYYKKQIYSDKNFNISKETAEPRMHFNYYMKNYDISNSDSTLPNNYNHLDIRDIKISWNLGMGEYRSFLSGSNPINKYLNYFQSHIVGEPIRLPFYKMRYSCIPFEKRKNNITACYGLYKNGNKFIKFHRSQTSDVIRSMKNFFIIMDGFLPLNQYHESLKNSHYALSPFGWGAICWKDFEIFLNGAVLIKPNMSHIETWPDYYKENETYVDYNWDASNLKEKVEELYSKPDLSRQVCAKGQDNFKYYNVLNNPQPFINRFQKIFSD